eukprot:3879554-Pyramimonas_sp.AAC.1
MVPVNSVRSLAHTTISKEDFEHVALTAHLGDAAENLVEPGESNCDIATLTCNFTRQDVATFPLTAEEIQERLGYPFAPHSTAEG